MWVISNICDYGYYVLIIIVERYRIILTKSYLQIVYNILLKQENSLRVDCSKACSKLN